MRATLAILACIAASAFCVNCHVIRSNDAIVVVPKQRIALENTFVDIRSWDNEDWDEHPELVHALMN